MRASQDFLPLDPPPTEQEIEDALKPLQRIWSDRKHRCYFTDWEAARKAMAKLDARERDDVPRVFNLERELGFPQHPEFPESIAHVILKARQNIEDARRATDRHFADHSDACIVTLVFSMKLES